MDNKYFSVIVGLMIATIAFLFIKEQKVPENKNTYSAAAPEASTNVFGVMTDDTSLNAKLFAIQSLGLTGTRETVLTTNYKGKSARCEFWNKNAITMFLNVNSNPQGQGYSFPQGHSLTDYVTKMVEIADKYKPFYVFVENEELNGSYHSGNLFGDYVGLIKVAIDSGHKHGIKIANGGFTSKQLVRMTYRYLLQTNDLNAQYFLEKCVPLADTGWLANLMTDMRQEKVLSENETLLRWYSSSDIDAINLHLYFPLKNRTKGQTVDKTGSIIGLNYILDYVHSVCPGKKIISNEVGFVENDSALSYNLFKALDSAGVESCFYGGQGSKRFVRNELPTKVGTGIKSYKP